MEKPGQFLWGNIYQIYLWEGGEGTEIQIYGGRGDTNIEGGGGKFYEILNKIDHGS